MAPRPSGTRSSSAVDAGALESARALLATWLPGRAADHVLDRAVRGAGLDAATADGESVAAMLLGPVYRELRDSVPRETLRRELKRLARRLSSEAREAGAARSPDADVPPGPLESEPAAEVDDVAAAPEAEQAPAPPRTSDVPISASADGVEPEVAIERGAAPADPDGVATALAILDGVHGVATFDAVGRVLVVRGDVDDASGLGRVLAAGGHLLTNHGALRSVAIVTTDGTLVSVPVSDRWIAVSGAPDMNLGAVYAALTTLEEER